MIVSMSLSSCPDCKGPLSASAKACPNCDYRVPYAYDRIVQICGALGILFVVLAFASGSAGLFTVFLAIAGLCLGLMILSGLLWLFH